jgi:hypothetical protein
MAAKSRICRVCYQPFSGRRDARTCSPRCRKRLQRTRQELAVTSQAVSYYTDPVKKAGSGGLVARALYAGRIRNLMLLALVPLLMLAAGPASIVWAEVSQGFLTNDQALSQNMAVVLTGEEIDGQQLVAAADANQPGSALGVAIGLADSLLAVSSASKSVFVTSNGPVKVYVSDFNGAPKVGDLLAVSPLKGVLMKSIDETKSSFGRALDDFDSSSSQEITISDNSGQPLSTKVALMDVNVDVNPPAKSSPDSDDDWLQSVAANIFGKELSSVRIIMILMVFVTMMLVAGEIIYSAVSGSITAIGRNPLARSAIARQSLRNGAFAGLVLLIGMLIIVLLVWL